MHSVTNEPSTVSQVVAGSRSGSLLGGEFLTVRVGHETYAFEILKVQEIRNFTQPTRIVGDGACTLGVINLRGVIVPIVDLRTLLDVSAEADAAGVVVVLTLTNRTVGMLVDSVCEVVQFGTNELRPAPSMGVESDTTHVIGLASLRDSADTTGHLCIVTDVEKLTRTALREAESTSQVLQ
jgi:purine-binding chemotaxis protein CheW